MRVMRNRTINYELGVRVTISCKMMFDDYPLDAHSCQFQVGSCEFPIGRQDGSALCVQTTTPWRPCSAPPSSSTTPPASAVCSTSYSWSRYPNSSVWFTSRQVGPSRTTNIATTNRPHTTLTTVCAAGHYAACGFQVRLQRKQMQYQIQVEHCTDPAHQLVLSGRFTFPASCSW